MRSIIPKNTADYIASFTGEIQDHLKHLQAIIRQAEPKATEGFSYNMPSVEYNKNKIWFAACKNHLSLYAMYTLNTSDDTWQAYKGKGTKHTLQFSYKQPLPVECIAGIVKDTLHRIE